MGSGMATRALVLGGGGVTGIAWQVGWLTGVGRAGVHVNRADVLVGTSAGSVVGARLAGHATLEALYEWQLADAAGTEHFRTHSQAIVDERNQRLLKKVAGDLIRARQLIGAFALRSPTPSVEQRLANIATRLDVASWPTRSLQVVAVNARSGQHRVFNAQSGVALISAVAASCAVPGIWPVVEIEGEPYMDGGVRSMTNADVAMGASKVLVLAPLGDSPGNPVSGHLRAEVQTLRDAGAIVQAVAPDSLSLEAIGENILDPDKIPAAARAGLSQGLRMAARMADFWDG